MTRSRSWEVTFDPHRNGRGNDKDRHDDDDRHDQSGRLAGHIDYLASRVALRLCGCVGVGVGVVLRCIVDLRKKGERSRKLGDLYTTLLSELRGESEDESILSEPYKALALCEGKEREITAPT